MSQAVIAVNNLNKTVPTAAGDLIILDDVNLEVEKGEAVAIVGSSGSGKTTLLGILAGLDSATSGSVRLMEAQLSDMNEEERAIARGKYTGFIFQSFQLLMSLTARENVMLPAELRGDEQAESQALELLEKVGLDSRLNHYPNQLSGGEQQRVALVRALAPKPRIMLMDEPFSGLDKRLRDDIRDETLEILKSEETAVLLVTHEPEEAMKMADEIALMRSGEIVQMGAPYNLYNAPVDRAAVAFFSDANIIKSKVNGALANSPFGQFFAPGLADGTHVEIVIRPQHVRIDFDRDGKGPLPTVSMGIAARGCVVRARFLGNESLVEFRMDFDNSIFKVTVPSVFLPKVGQPLWLTVPRDRCFVFPE